MSEVVTIGQATLYHGDCRDILPSLPRRDLALTDPPYGIGFAAQPTNSQRAAGVQATTWDNAAPDGDTIGAVLSSAKMAILWGGNYFALPPTRGWLIWMKTGNAPSMADFEMAWTNRDMNGRAFHRSVKAASLEKDLQSEAHPTQKPLGLMEWCLTFAPKAQTIIDPFMGSGTTGVACAGLGLAFTGIEKEKKYFDIACARIDRIYAQHRLFA
jgi:site-specific DNA-methyltransferase (adenine-specific)/modification methylase